MHSPNKRIDFSQFQDYTFKWSTLYFPIFHSSISASCHILQEHEECCSIIFTAQLQEYSCMPPLGFFLNPSETVKGKEPKIKMPYNFICFYIDCQLTLSIQGLTPIMIDSPKILPSLLKAFRACSLDWYRMCIQFPVLDICTGFSLEIVKISLFPNKL